MTITIHHATSVLSPCVTPRRARRGLGLLCLPAVAAGYDPPEDTSARGASFGFEGGRATQTGPAGNAPRCAQVRPWRGAPVTQFQLSSCAVHGMSVVNLEAMQHEGTHENRRESQRTAM